MPLCCPLAKNDLPISCWGSDWTNVWSSCHLLEGLLGQAVSSLNFGSQDPCFRSCLVLIQLLPIWYLDIAQRCFHHLKMTYPFYWGWVVDHLINFGNKSQMYLWELCPFLTLSFCRDRCIVGGILFFKTMFIFLCDVMWWCACMSSGQLFFSTHMPCLKTICFG